MSKALKPISYDEAGSLAWTINHHVKGELDRYELSMTDEDFKWLEMAMTLLLSTKCCRTTVKARKDQIVRLDTGLPPEMWP
jgi:hypothetical protein